MGRGIQFTHGRNLNYVKECIDHWNKKKLMALCERRMKTTIYKLAKGDRTVARVEDSARHGSVLDRIM